LAPTSARSPWTKARLERQIKVLANKSAEGKLGDEVYFERKRQLRSEIAALERSSRPGIPAAQAVEWLRALSETWLAADVQAEKAELLHAIYERIVVAGDRIVSARLTPEAQGHGMALALPQMVMARPTRVERADATNIRIPREGADIGLVAEGA
jgi:hypothetical protein